MPRLHRAGREESYLTDVNVSRPPSPGGLSLRLFLHSAPGFIDRAEARRRHKREGRRCSASGPGDDEDSSERSSDSGP